MDKIISFLEQNGALMLKCICILVIGLVLIKLIMKLFKKTLQKSKVDVTMHRFILSCLRIVLWIILIFTLLSNLHVDMTSLIAAFSVVGLAVSLAVQDILSHFIGGVVLLINKPFEIGDYVKVDDCEGTIMSINLFQTQINTIDNKVIYVPNGQISTNKITNYTKEPMRRLEVIVSISYHDNITQAKQLLYHILGNNPLALQDPEALVCVCAHADSAIQLMIRVWVMNENYWDLKFSLLEEIKEQFDQNGIQIPFPQMDVHMHQ